MRIFEAIMFGLFALGFFLMLMMWPGGSLAIILSLLLLSCFYFSFGFAFFNNIPLRSIGKKESYKELSTLRIIGSILAGVVLSTVVIGVMFGLMHWPGFYFMVVAGLTPAVIILGLAVFKSLTGPKQSYTRIITRIGFFAGFAFLLNFSPLAIDRIRYRNNPKLLKMSEARYEYQKNPTESNKIKMEVAEDRALSNGGTKRLDGSRVKHPDSITPVQE